MRKKLLVIIPYFALLMLSLAVPILHHCQTDRAIEAARPVVKLADGSYSTTLLPFPILFLRWLGQLSQLVPVVVAFAFTLSFWREFFARPTTICSIAICQCVFTTFYAFYAAALLGIEWLIRVH